MARMLLLSRTQRALAVLLLASTCAWQPQGVHSQLTSTEVPTINQTEPVPLTPYVSPDDETPVKITSFYDAGNAVVLDQSDSSLLQVAVRYDPVTVDEGDPVNFYQYFAFRLNAPVGEEVTISVTNSWNSSYALYGPYWGASVGNTLITTSYDDLYSARYSYDGRTWWAAQTRFEQPVGNFSEWLLNYAYPSGNLYITLTPEKPTVYIAYYPTYGYQAHLDSLNEIQALETPVPYDIRQIGYSWQGRPIDLVVVGDEDASQPKIWVITRQHPSESSGSPYVNAMIRRLLDPRDGSARVLLQNATFYFVPCINPDGVANGNHRASASGYNLNRQWDRASLEHAPEVYYVEKVMNATGVSFFLDVHMDEGIPYNFLDPPYFTSPWNDTNYEGSGMSGEEIFNMFQNAYVAATPDHQIEYGYGPATPNYRLAGYWVPQVFRCLGGTIEMPFKDLVDNPDHTTGWSQERSEAYGAAVLEPIRAILPYMPVGTPVRNDLAAFST